MKLKPSKLNIILDGQFGSTGKGVLSSYVASCNHIDICITNSSPNAGHTFYYNSKKYIVKHLPVSGIINKRSIIYLCAGSIINPDILLHELEVCNISKDRVKIHPRASIIESIDINNEQSGACVKLSSTQSGVGSALSRKINRESKLARGCVKLKGMISRLDVSDLLDYGCTALMEVPQGLGLSINVGYSYPYCTSRDITVSQAISDVGIHPSYLGKVMVCLRTYPIRVGNLKKDGKEIGYSGPFYPDSIETTWDELNLEKEYTTNTKRERRVASFSKQQYTEMLKILKPDYIFLNFVNYIDNTKLNKMLDALPEITHLGYGPTLDDIHPINTTM